MIFLFHPNGSCDQLQFCPLGGAKFTQITSECQKQRHLLAEVCIFLARPLVAANYGHTEIVRILAPMAIDPNAPAAAFDGATPILRAVQKGNTEIVRILIPYTKNPNAPDHDGRTPYQLAESLGNREIVQMLEPFCSESSLLCNK